MSDNEAQNDGQMSRRRFLRLATGGVLGLGLPAIGVTAYTTRIEPYGLSVSRLTVPLPGLDPAFDGFTIAHLTDWHLGEDWPAADQIARAIAETNHLQPDLVALTGDYVSHLGPDLAAFAGQTDVRTVLTRLLRLLDAPHGVYATLGNHDHWTDAPTVRAAIRATDVRLLTNESVRIERGGAALYVLGVDDIWEQQHDLDAALSGVPVGAPTVLLAHEGDFAAEAAATRRIGLQLSGHSHGGQVRVPLHGALILPWLGEIYDMGLYDVDGMTLYVNRGVGMIAPYVRFNCPPEVALITLAAASPL